MVTRVTGAALPRLVAQAAQEKLITADEAAHMLRPNITSIETDIGERVWGKLARSAQRGDSKRELAADLRDELWKKFETQDKSKTPALTETGYVTKQLFQTALYRAMDSWKAVRE